MAYTPPVGFATLRLLGSYSPPVGTVNLNLGATESLDKQAIIAATTPAPVASVSIHVPALTQFAAVIAATTAAPVASVQGVRDANLLSDVVQFADTGWAGSERLTPDAVSRFQDAAAAGLAAVFAFAEAGSGHGSAAPLWTAALRLEGAGVSKFRDAGPLERFVETRWQDANWLDAETGDRWGDGFSIHDAVVAPFKFPPLLTNDSGADWGDGRLETAHHADPFGDGRALLAVDIELWRQAGYPGNAPNPGPPLPPIFRPPWGNNLNLRCPLPGTTLRIGRVPCPLIAEREIIVRRTYMSINSAGLVRWPDLTPLPCTTMSIQTDFDSWCWELSATLAGPAAWDLVQPNPLACQVQATVNGQVWRFLLDVPSSKRAFNSDRVTLKGRSRSAWLHDPYLPSVNRSEANARTMQQLGEAALDNTGWTLDWQGEDWLVPAGRYDSHNTPIGVLIRLANTTDDGLYTHPSDQVITLRKRWPVASWLLDGEVVDLLIPESAVITLSQSPVYTQPLNGVYVSGTSHGALAFVKIAGTDGALQPAEPIINELLCDAAGVAARQRGLNALSDSGAGFEMDAEILFTPGIGLVRPGMIVSIAGMKGISRSVRISVQPANNGLSVRQSVGLERRE